MDEQLFYSVVLLLSMIFLCLLIPPSSKQEKTNLPKDEDIKLDLIRQLLYPKIIGQLATESESVIPLKARANQIEIIRIHKIDDSQISVQIKFPSYINDENRYADYIAIYLIDPLGNVESQKFNPIRIYEVELPFEENDIKELSI